TPSAMIAARLCSIGLTGAAAPELGANTVCSMAPNRFPSSGSAPLLATSRCNCASVSRLKPDETLGNKAQPKPANATAVAPNATRYRPKGRTPAALAQDQSECGAE